jgi:MarR family 2-MHQ and catechol resistance regulon transcriptional repressor
MAGRHGQHSNGVVDAIGATYRMLLRESEELLSKEGMTRAQFQALRCVAEKGPVPMKEISKKMFVTRANITGLIDKLESKGLVRRTAHDKDRRATFIELTPRGAAVQRRVSSKYRAFVQGALKVLTEDEQRDLRDVLSKLREGMSQAGR